MLVAQKNDGELFILQGHDDHEMLKILRKQQSFYCPQCFAPLLLKVGSIKIPHFSHVRHSACEQAFSEGETMTHLLAKQQLYQKFHDLQLDVTLEATIANFPQRPDLLVTTDDQSFAIEFQYSHIASELFHTRTSGYLKQQITPIWILHTPTTILSPGIQKISLSEFYKLFLTSYKNTPIILSYCPRRQSFYYLHHFMYVQKSTYICVVDELPIQHQSFPLLMPKAISYERFVSSYRLFEEYLMGSLRSRFYYSKQGVQDLFLRHLYELRLSLEELPCYLKMPLPGSEALHCMPSGWQCALFYFALQLKKTLWQLTKQEVRLFLQYSKLPVEEASFAVLKRYISICKKLQITSVYQPIDEARMLNILYGQFIAK